MYERLKRVDDRRVISGIIYVLKHGLQWRDVRKEYGPRKLCTLVLLTGVKRVYFKKSLNVLVCTRNNPPQQLQIDSTHIKVHRTATSLFQKGVPIVQLDEPRVD